MNVLSDWFLIIWQALEADVPLNFVVNRISINRNGSAILLAGSDGLRVMYLYGRSSMQVNTTICRYEKKTKCGHWHV